MRVLQVIQELRRGGAETVVLGLLDELESQGHPSAVAAASGPWASAFGPRRYELPILARRPSRLGVAVRDLRRAIRAFEPDVVHCHNPAMALVTSLATVRGRTTPALVTVHGVPEKDYPRAARLLNGAGLPVVGCGPAVTEALESHGGRVRSTIDNGVSAPPAPASRQFLDETLGVDPAHAVLLAVGRLLPQKRHDRAIRALPELPDTALCILGEGPLLDELTALARRLGVDDRVVFAGVRPDARALMAAADAVVMTSDWEGLPLTLLEALASDTPVVATRVRGIRELLTDDVDSLMVDPDDVDGLAVAVRTLLDDAPLRAQLTAGARATAARFSIEQMTSDYVALYEELVR